MNKRIKWLLSLCLLLLFCEALLAVPSFPENRKNQQPAACSTPENFSVNADYEHFERPAFVLTWDTVATAIAYNIYANNDLVHIETNATQSVLFGNYNTTYCFAITATCADNSTSDFSETLCETLTAPAHLCPTTQFLIAVCNQHQINIAWEIVPEAIGYQVIRDSEEIAFVTENSYVDRQLQTATTYCYSIQSICTDNASELSEEVCEMSDIQELESPFSLFPNPAHQYITIQSDITINNIEIFNLLGEKMTAIQPEHHTTKINIEGWKSGIYIIRILSNGTAFHQKIFVQ